MVDGGGRRTAVEALVVVTREDAANTSVGAMRATTALRVATARGGSGVYRCGGGGGSGCGGVCDGGSGGGGGGGGDSGGGGGGGVGSTHSSLVGCLLKCDLWTTFLYERSAMTDGT